MTGLYDEEDDLIEIEPPAPRSHSSGASSTKSFLSLRVVSGPDTGRVLLNIPTNCGAVYVGRSAASGSTYSLRLGDTAVSNRHIQLAFHPEIGGFVVRDCGSTNGTQLNGEAMVPEQLYKLVSSDCIRIGTTRINVQISSRMVEEVTSSPKTAGPGADSMDRCPVCMINLLTMTVLDRHEHINSCLDSPHARPASGSAAPPPPSSSARKSTVTCTVCQQSLDHLAPAGREEHVNRCLDRVEELHLSPPDVQFKAAKPPAPAPAPAPVRSNSIASSAGGASAAAAAPDTDGRTLFTASTYSCPSCNKCLDKATPGARIKHIKDCAAKPKAAALPTKPKPPAGLLRTATVPLDDDDFVQFDRQPTAAKLPAVKKRIRSKAAVPEPTRATAARLANDDPTDGISAAIATAQALEDPDGPTVHALQTEIAELDKHISTLRRRYGSGSSQRRAPSLITWCSREILWRQLERARSTQLANATIRMWTSNAPNALCVCHMFADEEARARSKLPTPSQAASAVFGASQEADDADDPAANDDVHMPPVSLPPSSSVGAAFRAQYHSKDTVSLWNASRPDAELQPDAGEQDASLLPEPEGDLDMLLAAMSQPVEPSSQPQQPNSPRLVARVGTAAGRPSSQRSESSVVLVSSGTSGGASVIDVTSSGHEVRAGSPGASSLLDSDDESNVLRDCVSEADWIRRAPKHVRTVFPQFETNVRFLFAQQRQDIADAVDAVVAEKQLAKDAIAAGKTSSDVGLPHAAIASSCRYFLKLMSFLMRTKAVAAVSNRRDEEDEDSLPPSPHFMQHRRELGDDDDTLPGSQRSTGTLNGRSSAAARLPAPAAPPARSASALSSSQSSRPPKPPQPSQPPSSQTQKAPGGSRTAPAPAAAADNLVAPDYSKFSLEQLKLVAKEFGVRPGSKSMMASQLSKIWRFRHGMPDVDEESDGESLVGSQSSRTSGKGSKKPTKAQQAAAVTDFIRDNAELHERVLTMQPMDLSVLHSQMVNAGISVTVPVARTALQEQGVSLANVWPADRANGHQVRK